MSEKLRISVVYSSSEDPDYPAVELNAVNPSSVGWQSARFCEYPQELGFELLDGDCNIRQIQILNHQSKIPSRIEIYIGTGSSYEAANFKRLGYMSIDSNERSGYQARELKTVFVDSVGRYFRLLINQNHPNKVNVFNQVGIIAVSLNGNVLDSEAKQVSTPKVAIDRAKSVPRNIYNDLSTELNLDPHTANKLRQLADAKSKAIENEDYLTAKQIKTVEQDLRTLGSRLAQLDLAKTEAVANEDYDLAKEIKDQCDDLRREIEGKIRTIQIPGVKLSSPAPTKVPKFAPSKDDGYEEEISVRRNNGNFMNVDDLPVGGHAETKKKPVKIEAFHHPSFDENAGSAHGLPVDYADEEDSHLDVMERPIKPKAHADYNDRDPMIEEPEPAGGTGMPTESFPVGEHPLEGIQGFLDLPTPEALSIKSKEFCDQHGLVKLLGDYRARCLFSKSWNLREAVVLKVQELLKKEFASDMSGSLAGLCGVIKVGVEDKMQQVVFSALDLLESVLKSLKSAKLPRSQVTPAFDHVLTQLIEKLADGNARIRDSGRKGVDLLAASAQVGPGAVASHLVRPLPAKQKTNWRPIASRLDVLAALVTEYGLNNQSGLHMDSILSFPKTTQAFAHSHGEVRDGAKKLVVAIHKEVGTGPLEPTLALLRKKQREEYEAAFAAPASEGQGAKKDSGSTPAKRTDMSHQHATHNPGGKVPTSQARVEEQSKGYNQHNDAGDQGEEKADFTSCMFCGVKNKKWTENDLDLHYWKDCPLLISCPSCAQIVEIAGLPEHLLDECEAKDDYVPCDVTGLAIRKNEFNQWKKSQNCVPAPENYMYCPLCHSTVEDSDSAWLNHLTKKCDKNSRIHSS